MRIVYAREALDAIAHPIVFLAGPTPRNQDVASWRPAAIDVLETAGFSGTVLIPEDRGGVFRGDYLDQVEWEWAGLAAADVIVFWGPRHADLPGFTTNVEFGLCARSGKVVLGAPADAEKVRYLQWVATKLRIPVCVTLLETINAALSLVEHRRRDADPAGTVVVSCSCRRAN